MLAEKVRQIPMSRGILESALQAALPLELSYSQAAATLRTEEPSYGDLQSGLRLPVSGLDFPPQTRRIRAGISSDGQENFA